MSADRITRDLVREIAQEELQRFTLPIPNGIPIAVNPNMHPSLHKVQLRAPTRRHDMELPNDTEFSSFTRHSDPVSTSETSVEYALSRSSTGLGTSSSATELSDKSMEITKIRALLCGVVTQYMIQYGTQYQSTIANEMLEETDMVSKDEAMLDDENIKCTFAFHLQHVYDVAGEILWLQAMNHFKGVIRPHVGGLRLDDDTLDEAMSILQRKNLCSGDMNVSLVTLCRLHNLHTKYKPQDEIFEHDESFE